MPDSRPILTMERRVIKVFVDRPPYFFEDPKMRWSAAAGPSWSAVAHPHGFGLRRLESDLEQYQQSYPLSVVHDSLFTSLVRLPARSRNARYGGGQGINRRSIAGTAFSGERCAGAAHVCAHPAGSSNTVVMPQRLASAASVRMNMLSAPCWRCSNTESHGIGRDQAISRGNVDELGAAGSPQKPKNAAARQAAVPRH